ncbi:MAG: hypothetical protein RMX96_08710 [Nostoc sp. ChiSLP02]|nr:hypothetical protein [Nostoc sp. DedSLP05]MDZ8101807.1 hypothetical protein [Nostoc sp. DedSLP01]MDZ8184919.1 hypothetical protein [Nostoc sp. ChiSLP02]
MKVKLRFYQSRKSTLFGSKTRFLAGYYAMGYAPALAIATFIIRPLAKVLDAWDK